MFEEKVSERENDLEICLLVENTQLKKKLEEKENTIKEKEKILVEKEGVIKNLQNQILGRGKFIMIIESFKLTIRNNVQIKLNFHPKKRPEWKSKPLS